MKYFLSNFIIIHVILTMVIKIVSIINIYC